MFFYFHFHDTFYCSNNLFSSFLNINFHLAICRKIDFSSATVYRSSSRVLCKNEKLSMKFQLIFDLSP